MRLPEFLREISPVRETLTALEREVALLREETAAHNRQLSVSTADSGLSLWEADHGLSGGGGDEARRTRIYTALMGGQTLIVEQLKALAVTAGGAERAEVEMDIPNHRVNLILLGTGWHPACTKALAEAVERLKPAHLIVTLESRAELTAETVRYPAWTGTMILEAEEQDEI